MINHKIFLPTIFVCILVLVIKYILQDFKRPNGDKYGVVSFHTAFAFSVLTMVYLTIKDKTIIALVGLLALFVSITRIVEYQHYLYQVILGVIIGVFGTIFMYKVVF